MGGTSLREGSCGLCGLPPCCPQDLSDPLLEQVSFRAQSVCIAGWDFPCRATSQCFCFSGFCYVSSLGATKEVSTLYRKLLLLWVITHSLEILAGCHGRHSYPGFNKELCGGITVHDHIFKLPGRVNGCVLGCPWSLGLQPCLCYSSELPPFTHTLLSTLVSTGPSEGPHPPYYRTFASCLGMCPLLLPILGIPSIFCYVSLIYLYHLRPRAISTMALFLICYLSLFFLILEFIQ